MKKTNKFIGILSVSLIAIVTVVFVAVVSNGHLAKGTYSAETTGCDGSSWGLPSNMQVGDIGIDNANRVLKCLRDGSIPGLLGYLDYDGCLAVASHSWMSCDNGTITCPQEGTYDGRPYYMYHCTIVECDPGYYISSGDSCSACSLGYYCTGGHAAEARACSPGHYQDEEGQTSCKVCPANTYQDESGANFCLECPPGKTSPAGSDDLSDCVDSDSGPSTASPSTASPSTARPSTARPSTASPSTASPSTAGPSTASPSTASPGTGSANQVKIYFSVSGAITSLTCTPGNATSTCSIDVNRIPGCSEWCADPEQTNCNRTAAEIIGPYSAGHEQYWYCKTGSTSTPSTAKPSTAKPSTASPSTASPSTAGPSTTTAACYLVNHKYEWATKKPTNGNLVIDINDKNNCAGCEIGYTLDGDKCVSTTPPSVNPPTGTTAIIFVWLVGLCAIGYSFWYFKKTNTNK